MSEVKLEKRTSARSQSSNKAKDTCLVKGKVKEQEEEEKRPVAKSVEKPKIRQESPKDVPKAPSSLVEFNKLIGTLLLPAGQQSAGH